MIQIKRAYDPPGPEDGQRFLVDRLWPRGINKAKLKLTVWNKGAAPSDALRKKFHHDPAQWKEFQLEYWAELEKNPSAWEPLLDAAEKGKITLLYGAKDQTHNNALALKLFLECKLVGRKGGAKGHTPANHRAEKSSAPPTRRSKASKS